MKLIERQINGNTATTKNGEFFQHCQASFNSDGNITLRNYNVQDKSIDEIIILSAEETQAIIELLSKMKKILKIDSLPF